MIPSWKFRDKRYTVSRKGMGGRKRLRECMCGGILKKRYRIAGEHFKCYVCGKKWPTKEFVHATAVKRTEKEQ